MTNNITDKDGNIIGELTIFPKESATETGKVIVFVIGHDSDRQGAYGNAGISEWQFNDQFINDSFGRFPKRHTYYVMYRDSDIRGYGNKMIDLHKRIAEVNADIAIELHFNDTTDKSVNGNEVLYCASSSKGKALAKKLDESFDSLPNRDRGTKPVSIEQNGGGFCCRGNAICIISEPFFASQQSNYVYGGKYRETLTESYIDFLNKI